MTYAKRTDATQAEIVQALRDCGCAVALTFRVGAGYPDLTVGMPDGRNVLLECKVPGGKLTDDERRFMAEWPGELYVVDSVDSALAAVGLA